MAGSDKMIFRVISVLGFILDHWPRVVRKRFLFRLVIMDSLHADPSSAVTACISSNDKCRSWTWARGGSGSSPPKALTSPSGGYG